MPLGLHWPELIILVGVALLIFGPKRLPEMGSAMGKTIKEFQRSMREVTGGGEKNEVPAIPPAATPEPSATVTPEPSATGASEQPTASAAASSSETKAE